MQSNGLIPSGCSCGGDITYFFSDDDHYGYAAAEGEAHCKRCRKQFTQREIKKIKERNNGPEGKDRRR